MGRVILGSPWITLIGGACYSIYLMHLPVMQAGAEVIRYIARPHSLALASLLSWAILIPLSIVVGMVFYACIERPCMRPNWPRELAQAIKAWWMRRHSAAAATPQQTGSTVATPPYP
jgi:peptidoglycan/LPS O-acetylase OafA/YrhL